MMMMMTSVQHMRNIISQSSDGALRIVFPATAFVGWVSPAVTVAAPQEAGYRVLCIGVAGFHTHERDVSGGSVQTFSSVDSNAQISQEGQHIVESYYSSRNWSPNPRVQRTKLPPQFGAPLVESPEGFKK